MKPIIIIDVLDELWPPFLGQSLYIFLMSLLHGRVASENLNTLFFYVSMALFAIYRLRFIIKLSMNLAYLQTGKWEYTFKATLTILLFKNFASFAQVYTLKMNQNALIAKINKCEKTWSVLKYGRKETNIKVNKFPLKSC